MVLVLIIVDEQTVRVDLLVYLTVAVTVGSGAGYFYRLQRASADRRDRRIRNRPVASVHWLTMQTLLDDAGPVRSFRISSR